MRKWHYTAILLLAGISCAGCSVMMAMHGKPSPDYSVLAVGQPRELVHMSLGQPTKTFTDTDGTYDVFELQPENEPSAERAVAHAGMDVLTFGAWELFGTPLETMAAGHKSFITVQYDKMNRVQSVARGASLAQRMPLPEDPALAEEPVEQPDAQLAEPLAEQSVNVAQTDRAAE